ncbi:hypothetical protein E2320_001003 [Naja naja]|nr:hypothetical protein E2320_001003 [Naja naja]
MDIVEHILAVAKVIYDQYQHMKYCKKQKERLIKRMEILLRPIELLQAQPLSKLSSSLNYMLQNMLDLLLEAQALFEKYQNHNMLERFMKAGEMLEEFANLNERFGDMGQGLSLQLQVEQKVLVSFQKCMVSKECCQDLAEDKVCWKEMTKGQQEGVHTEITEINKDFLTRMTFLLEMKDHILYKGEYYKSPVAIKVFKNPLTVNTKKVREIFEEEIRTLKRLESSYIFSIITEYCEKGTLREVLRKEQDLPWKIRCDMASDAAAGLYSCQDLNWTKQSRPSVKKANIKSPGSFGIVLWEIATGKLPFTEIYMKVYKQKVQEPLGEDCPSYLQTIINQCRSYNPSKRPTTEVIVNKLLIDQDDNSSNLTS